LEGHHKVILLLINSFRIELQLEAFNEEFTKLIEKYDQLKLDSILSEVQCISDEQSSEEAKAAAREQAKTKMTLLLENSLSISKQNITPFAKLTITQHQIDLKERDPVEEKKESNALKKRLHDKFVELSLKMNSEPIQKSDVAGETGMRED